MNDLQMRENTEIAQLRTELDDSTETSRKAVELMNDAVAEVVTLRAALAETKSRLLDAQVGRTIWMERSKANAAEYNEAYDAMCDIAQMLDCAEDWPSIKAVHVSLLAHFENLGYSGIRY